MSTQDRIAQLEAEVAHLSSEVDYRDPGFDLADRIKAAEASGDWTWARSLKNEQARSLFTVKDEAAAQQDFRDANNPTGPTLQEQIAEARENGDNATANRLMIELGKAQVIHRMKAPDASSPLLEAAHRHQAGLAAKAAENQSRGFNRSYSERIAEAEAAGDHATVARLSAELAVQKDRYDRDVRAKRDAELARRAAAS